MITIILIRKNKQGKAVNGTMTFMMRNRLPAQFWTVMEQLEKKITIQ